MTGSDQARLMEINMLSEAIAKAEAIDFGDNAIRDAFVMRAKTKLQQLLSDFVGN